MTDGSVVISMPGDFEVSYSIKELIDGVKIEVASLRNEIKDYFNKSTLDVQDLRTRVKLLESKQEELRGDLEDANRSKTSWRLMFAGSFITAAAAVISAVIAVTH